MTDAQTKEIYIRFTTKKFGSGVFEAPAATIDEAAGQFCDDAVSTVAVEITLDARGRMVSARDVTEEVLDHLKDMIENDQFTRCPHPLLEDAFRDWEEECERTAREDADHVRQEAMLSIYLKRSYRQRAPGTDTIPLRAPQPPQAARGLVHSPL